MIDPMSLSLVIRDLTMPGSREREDALPVMSEDEFRSFYERTARPLWSYLSRLTGDRQQTDDLVQEAFYRIYRLGARHENEAHRRNCLFQIATNLARDAARRGRRRVEVPLDERAPGRAPVPERQAEIRTDLARAWEKLEPVQRELLWLAYAQGASHQEIAAIVGVRAVSVRTLLLRARRKLAAMLTGRGPEARP